MKNTPAGVFLKVRRRRAVDVIQGEAPPGVRAFEDLISDNLDSLYRTAERLCREPEDARDLVQETALRAFDHREQLRDRSAGRAWLFRILQRTHLNRVRGESRRRESGESDLGEAEFESALAQWSRRISGDDWLDRLADRQRLQRAIDGIDPRLRIVLLLSDVEEFSQREVASILELPQGTVASRLFRARQALREILSRDGDSAGATSRRAV